VSCCDAASLDREPSPSMAGDGILILEEMFDASHRDRLTTMT